MCLRLKLSFSLLAPVTSGEATCSDRKAPNISIQSTISMVHNITREV